MKILRYFASYAIITIALTILCLVVLVVAVSLVENAGDLSNAQTGFSAALWLALFDAIYQSYQIVPIACFLGVLIAGTLLAQHGEILAAQAGGISQFYLLRAFFLVVLGLGIGAAACGEFVVPRAVSGIERVQRQHLKHSSTISRFFKKRIKWYRSDEWWLYLPSVDKSHQIFYRPSIYRFQDGLISEVIEAQSMHYRNSQWVLKQVHIHVARENKTSVQTEFVLALDVTPQNLLDVTGDPRQMSYLEITRLIQRRRQAGFSVTAHVIELHSRWTVPLSTFGLFLIIAPWAMHPERRRSIASTLGMGVVTIAVLISLSYIFRLLALGQKIPSYLGAWGLSIVCCLVIPLSWMIYNRYRKHGHIF